MVKKIKSGTDKLLRALSHRLENEVRIWPWQNRVSIDNRDFFSFSALLLSFACICLSVCLSMYLSVYVSLCLSVCLCECLSVCLYVL